MNKARPDYPRIYRGAQSGAFIHVTYNNRKNIHDGFALETHEGNGVCVVVLKRQPYIVRTITANGKVIAEDTAYGRAAAHAKARRACDQGHTERY